MKKFILVAVFYVFSLPVTANETSADLSDWQDVCLATGWLDSQCVQTLFPEDFKRLTFQPIDLSKIELG